MNRFLFLALMMTEPLLSNSINSTWEKTKKESEYLVIDPTPYLSRKQKKLIYSGFPAYSSISLIVDTEDKEYILKTHNCAIEYDLWDERFSLLFSSSDPNFTIRSSKDYFDHCLTFTLSDSIQVRTLLKGESIVKMRVAFTQISGKTNSEITSWLVQQQTQVLKGIFSHMLGELKLEEVEDFEVVLPEKAEEAKGKDKS